MNTKIIGVVVGVVVVGLIVYFAMANKKEDDSGTPTTESTNTQQQNQDQPSTKNSSLKDLASSGSQKCTFDDDQSNGTVYVANGKTRMEFSTVSNGVTMNSQAIMDGENYYGWVDGQPSGYKFSIKDSSTGSAGSNQNVDINKQVSYNCSNWSVDSSKFSLPANVQFTDLSAYKMPGM